MADVQVGDVLVSPDGATEIATTSRAQIVELKFAGWAPKNRRTERRQRRPDASTPKPARSPGEQAKAAPAARPDPTPDDAA